MHSNQKRIKTERQRYNVICCGRRFGKDILCVDLAIETLLKGGKVGWFQPTYKSLIEVWRLIKKLLENVTPRRGANTQDKRIEIITGGVIEFWSLDSDPEACRGRKYHRAIVNEAAKVRQLQTAWRLAIRPTLGDYRGDAYFPSTPRGRDYYHELYQLGTERSLTYNPRWRSWKMPTHANPHMSREELAEIERDEPATVYSQEYLAEFLDVAGRFFDEWEPTRKISIVRDGALVEVEEEWHVVEPFAIPAHWNVWVAGDPGTSKHTRTHANLFFAADEEGGIVIFDEIYESGKLAKDQSNLLLDKLETYRRAEPVDPSRREGLWKVNIKASPFDYASFFPPDQMSAKPSPEMLGKWPVEWYWERGLPIVRAVKDRIAGWRALKQLLHDVIVFKDAEGEDDVRPKLRVFRGRCANFIRTMPLMIRDARNSEDIEEEKLGVTENEGHLEQHLVDCGRYGAMTRPKASPRSTASMTIQEQYEETNRLIHEEQLRKRDARMTTQKKKMLGV